MSAQSSLREHFSGVEAENQANGWEALWKDKNTPWDRSVPNPALVDTLNEKTDLLGSPLKDMAARRRKRALVPGSGRGYDVLLLASYGYDAYGLDTAETAVEESRRLKEREGRDPEKYPTKDASVGAGEAKFIMANFFSNHFLTKTEGAEFDLIYDYTFLCALPPELRPKWAKRMSELLASDGDLICVEFPLSKEPKTGGPPHGLSSPLYVALFKQPGTAISYDEQGYALANQQSGAGEESLKRIAHWQPEKTHAVGKGTDMVSIWRHGKVEKTA